VPRVLITDNLSPAGLEKLEAAGGIEVVVKSGLTPEQVREELKEADGIIVRSGTKLTPEVLAGQTRLKAVARAGVGVDNIDLPAATKAGVVVMNTPSGNTVSTAEQTLALMFALSRNTAPAAQSMAEGKWDRKKYTGTQLAGKTIGVVGLGRIGQAVARRCVALEMDVIGYDPFLSSDRAKELGVELVRDVDALIPRVDYLTVHTPLTDETRGLIDADRMAAMKKGVRLLNCARGGIIDEAALAAALKSGHVGGAGLDVYSQEPPPADSPLNDAPNLLRTPHLGASTEEAQELVAVEAAEIMANFLKTGEIRHAVNMVPVSGAEMAEVRPYLDLGYRLGVLLSQITGSAGVNGVKLAFRGDAAKKKTGLVTGAFAAGLLADAVEDVNLVNAAAVARDRGITLEESKSESSGDFATSVSATVTTDAGEHTVAGTLFGSGYLRLIRLDGFHLDAFLDGTLLIYRHRDVPGLIGFIGTLLGEDGTNIADMSLGRSLNEAGGDSVAVLHLDQRPSDAAMAKIADHPEVTGVRAVKLPARGEALPGVLAAAD
jgi:D-3-phosphoglycerate dehydrogenase